jgi:4-hydroxythreonine-4-phosphate dehydrogenase
MTSANGPTSPSVSSRAAAARPRVAITPGDPRGIGPELVAQVMAGPPEGAEYVLIGIAGEVGARTTGKGKGETSAGGRFPFPPSRFTGSQRDAGLAVKSQIESAVALALAGEVDAIVTGPAEKHALHLAGIPYPGHTEWLAALAGGVDVAMMLTDERLRVVLVTTHMALRAVPDAVTREAIERVGALTVTALRDRWGLPEPRLAVCALNPHAGEAGLFGSEDATVLAPAARALGAAGPLPADTVFVRALRGEFDAVLAPYHDVGMTAIKVAAFGRAVNVTLGLPFVRTAPDHGTALDIAGKGIADPGSLRAAVELAVRLAGRRAATRRA